MKTISIIFFVLIGLLLAGCASNETPKAPASIVGKLSGTTFWTKTAENAYNANKISRTVSENFLGGGASSAETETKADWLVWISTSGISELRVVVKYHGSVVLQGDYYPEETSLYQNDVNTLGEDLRGVISRFGDNRANRTASKPK